MKTGDGLVTKNKWPLVNVILLQFILRRGFKDSRGRGFKGSSEMLINREVGVFFETAAAWIIFFKAHELAARGHKEKTGHYLLNSNRFSTSF